MCLKTSPLNIEKRPTEKNGVELINLERSLFLGWQSPLRKLFLAMANTI